MQFGVFDHLDDSGASRAEQLDQRLALIEQYERNGFYAYHLAEHHGTPLGIVGSPNLFLAAAAQRTSSIRLGPLVNVLPLYHPIRLVEEWCLLDHMSGGRLEPGIGRGASPIEASFFGVDADSTPARFEETLAVILQALEGGVVDHHGEYVDVDQLSMTARPLQTPRPPFWFGASRPDRAEWCAERSINVMSLVSAQRTHETSQRFRERWLELGRPEAALPRCGVNRHMVLADSETEALRIAERVYPRFKASLDHLWKLRGMAVPPIYAGTWGELQELGNGFAGTPEGARHYVRDQIDTAGINYMTIDMAFGGISFEEASYTASLFSTEVMPDFTQGEIAA